MNDTNKLAAAIEMLRNLTKMRLITSVNLAKETFADCELLKSYFEAPFDSEEDSRIEKLIATASVRSISEKLPLSKELKERVIKSVVEHNLDALRFAKLEYKKEDITLGEYRRRIEMNKVAKTVARVERVKRRLLYRGVKYGVKYGVVTIAGVIATSVGAATVPAVVVGIATVATIELLQLVIPKEVKAKINRGVNEAISTCADMVSRTLETVGRTAQQLYQKGKEVVATVKETASKVVGKVAEKANTIWQRIKAGVGL